MFRKTRYWAIPFIIMLLVVAILIGRFAVSDVRAEGGTYERLKLFTEVLSVVQQNYVEPVDDKTLIYDAINGMLRSLDPHSSFLTPDGYKEMQVDTRGEFGGLGIQISMKNSMLTVIAPIDDTPASRAGIQAGDRIIKINGESTDKLNLQDAVTKMRGKPDTSVTITVIRSSWKAPRDFTLVRAIIVIKSVKSKMLEKGIGYIKVSAFNEKTANETEAALKQLMSEKMTSLVLDLRNNPGGLLKSAIDISDMFLPANHLVVYTKARNGEKVEYRTRSGSQLPEIPIVVLVNPGSASASEIVAGALKDWKRAVIMGEQTFGKGSVQSVIPLSDGAALRLTTSKYYTPNGESIQNTGITPDIVEKLKGAESDKAHHVLREKDLSGHLNNEQKDESKILTNAPEPPQAEPQTEPQTEPQDDTDQSVMLVQDEKSDNQLQRAIDLLKTWAIFKKLPEGSVSAAPPTGN